MMGNLHEDENEASGGRGEILARLSELERPGWSRTRAEQVEIERLRGELAVGEGGGVEEPVSSGFVADLARCSLADRVEAVLMWEHRVQILGPYRFVPRMTMLARGERAYLEYGRRVVAASPAAKERLAAWMAVERYLSSMQSTDPVSEDRGSEALARVLAPDPEGSCDAERSVRYLSAGEHEFLTLAARVEGIAASFGTAGIRGCASELADAGLVTGEGRLQITPEGREALREWRYEVWAR